MSGAPLFRLAAALLVGTLPAFVGGQARLSNAHIEVVWTAGCGISFLGRSGGNNTVDPAEAAWTWTIQAVGSQFAGAVTIPSTLAACNGVHLDGECRIRF